MKKILFVLALFLLVGFFALPHDLDGAASLPPSLNVAPPEVSIPLLEVDEVLPSITEIVVRGLARAPPIVRAAKTWVGTTDSLWSTATNWVQLAVPATTDAVTFNVTGTARACTMDNLGTWSGGTLTIDSAYANTITQNTGINVNIAAFSQASGTVTCHASATWTSTTSSITAGTFNQGGAFVSTTFGCTGTGVYVGSSATMSTTAVTHSNTASITACSAVWSLAGSWTTNNSPTFVHNSGTITITAASTFHPLGTLNLVIINTAGNNAVTISAGTTAPLGASPASNNGTSTLTVAGVATFSSAWTHAGSLTVTGTLTGTGTPTLSLDRSLTTSGATITNPIGTVTFSSTAGTTSTYTDTSAALTASTFVVTKSGGGTFTVAANTTANLGANPISSVDAGTITATGTINLSGAWDLQSTGSTALTVSSGGILSGAITTINCSRAVTINSASTIPSGININWTPPSSTARTFDGGGKTFGVFRRIGSQSATLTFASSNTFTTIRDNDGLVAHTLQFTAGTTQTITGGTDQYMIAGKAGKIVTVASTVSMTPFILHSTGTKPINWNYCAISDCTVDETLPEWWAGDYASANGGGNTGWRFKRNPRLRAGGGN